MKTFPIALLCAAALPATAGAQPRSLDPVAALRQVAALRDAALTDDVAYAITEGLTTEVGQRLAGTDAEARARDWGVARLKALGFRNVHIETYDMPVWVRGEERGEILSPFPQKLSLTALGNSGATPPAGLDAEIVAFPSIEALRAADPAAVRGRIVYLTHAMLPTQDGSSYGASGIVRRQGPTVASQKGAAAIVIRSIGTDHHRTPHTGVQMFADGAAPIPAAALSIPDAEQLDRILKRGRPVRMRLLLTPRQTGMRQSGNVVAEVPGRDPKAGIVVVGGHLDSWDLGTGAIDDATGIAITTAAAKRVMDAGRPLRTIRVVWFGAEEVGAFGGIAYAKAHAGEKHVLMAESDFGADRVWKFDTKVAPGALPVMDRIATALAPLGIARGDNLASGGSDITPLAATGIPIVSLRQDGTRYFDLHHTPDDTLDKVDPIQLRQNVAAWTTMLAVVANDPTELGPVEKGGAE
ncbi:M28 family peptidase [Sphingomonas montana]|uniref:M28 family peptidase n=1 Tax=Sphingomonas montana TaxID=1843236 RepID=UPI00096C5E0E|nr:M28 family peptidase [Sphingomonas montana]